MKNFSLYHGHSLRDGKDFQKNFFASAIIVIFDISEKKTYKKGFCLSFTAFLPPIDIVICRSPFGGFLPRFTIAQDELNTNKR